MAKAKKKAAKKATKPKAAKAAKPAKAEKPEKVVLENEDIVDLARPMGDGHAAVALAKAFTEHGRMNDPNKGRLTVAQWKVAYCKHHHINADMEDLETDAPKIPPTLQALYQPLVMDFTKLTNARSIVTCLAKAGARKPSAWNEAKFGPWKPGLRIADYGEVRTCHKTDARKLVRDAENLVTLRIGSAASGKDVSFVIGNDKDSAVFCVGGSKSGSYGANSDKGARLSFADTKGLDNIVGQFRPDYSVDLLDDQTDPGMSLGWGPNMVVDWGYAIRGERKLSYAQMRTAATKYADGDKDACKGIKFERLSAPIIGEGFTQGQLWQRIPAAVKEITDTDKGWYNLRSVQTRVSPHEVKPNGFFALQVGIVPVSCFGGTLDSEQVKFVIAGGKVRLAQASIESRTEARSRLGLDTPPVKKTAKKATAKKATVKKATAKKATVKKATSQAASDAAPITRDTEPEKTPEPATAS